MTFTHAHPIILTMCEARANKLSPIARRAVVVINKDRLLTWEGAVDALLQTPFDPKENWEKLWRQEEVAARRHKASYDLLLRDDGITPTQEPRLERNPYYDPHSIL